MVSESVACNHFLAVVRASIGLLFLKVSRKFNDTDLRYRASNIITIHYIIIVGAHFKSAVGGVRESSRNHFQALVRASRGLYYLKVSRKFNDTDLRYGASNMITIPYIMQVGTHFKSGLSAVRESSP